MVSLNLSGVGIQPDPMPEGVYTVEFTKHTTVLSSKRSGQPYVNAEFSVIDDEEYGGRRLFYIVSLQPQSLWNLRLFLTIMGASDAEMESDFDVDQLLKKLYGARCKASVVVNSFTDDSGVEHVNNRVTRIHAYTDDVVTTSSGRSPF